MFQWLELHGDRAGYDDPALITGIGKMEGMSFMFIGHQKGRNTKENIFRNFAMPTPNGYDKLYCCGGHFTILDKVLTDYG